MGASRVVTGWNFEATLELSCLGPMGFCDGHPRGRDQDLARIGCEGEAVSPNGDYSRIPGLGHADWLGAPKFGAI